MRNTAIGALVLFALSGCLTFQTAIPRILPDRDVETYGVRIIRPGLSKEEVEAIVNCGARVSYTTGAVFVNEWHYGPITVRYDGYPGRVEWCQTQIGTSTGMCEASFDDLQLSRMLTTGTPAADVQKLIGRPECGYTKAPGEVVTVHPQPGVEIRYIDGLLKSWRRVRFYEQLNADSKPSLAQPDNSQITD